MGDLGLESQTPAFIPPASDHSCSVTSLHKLHPSLASLRGWTLSPQLESQNKPSLSEVSLVRPGHFITARGKRYVRILNLTFADREMDFSWPFTTCWHSLPSFAHRRRRKCAEVEGAIGPRLLQGAPSQKHLGLSTQVTV